MSRATGKALPCSKREVEAGRVPEIALIVVAQTSEVLETGQIVIQGHRPETGPFVDLNIQAAPDRHGKGSLRSAEAGRNRLTWANWNIALSRYEDRLRRQRGPCRRREETDPFTCANVPSPPQY